MHPLHHRRLCGCLRCEDDGDDEGIEDEGYTYRRRTQVGVEDHEVDQCPRKLGDDDRQLEPGTVEPNDPKHRVEVTADASHCTVVPFLEASENSLVNARPLGTSRTTKAAARADVPLRDAMAACQRFTDDAGGALPPLRVASRSVTEHGYDQYTT